MFCMLTFVQYFLRFMRVDNVCDMFLVSCQMNLFSIHF